MTKSFYILLFFSLFYSCKEKTGNKELYNVRTDIRFGTKFYSIFINEQGQAYVIKGVDSYYRDTLKIESSDTSKIFKLDSAKVFFDSLNKIKVHPIVGAFYDDAPRVEIYYDHQKIYDAYSWDETFWVLFRPIMEQIPKGYNPFRVSDYPF